MPELWLEPALLLEPALWLLSEPALWLLLETELVLMSVFVPLCLSAKASFQGLLELHLLFSF